MTYRACRTEDVSGPNDELFRQVVEEAPDGMLVVDEAGTIVEVNRTLLAMVKADKRTLVGGPMEVLLPPPQRQSHVAFRNGYLQSPRIRPIAGASVLTLQAFDGTTLPVEISLSPVVVAGRTLVVAAVRDVRDRLRLEEELTTRTLDLEMAIERIEAQGADLACQNETLEVMRDEAHAASLEKSSFLARVSHEIRTPLNGLYGTLRLLQEAPITGEYRELLRIADQAATSLLSLVNEVLDWSKIEAGHLVVEHKSFSVREIVEDVVRLHALQSRSKDVWADSIISPALPAAVEGDAKRFRQVVGNLVGNAFKFTKHGHIVVRVNVECADAGPALVVEVEDTGCGVSPEDASRLFRPYVQTEAGTGHQGGTGLGLAICKRLVEAMGGVIALRSTGTSGTTVRFTIALSRPCDDSTVGAGHDDASARLRERRIVLVGLPAVVEAAVACRAEYAGGIVRCVADVGEIGRPGLEHADGPGYDVMIVSGAIPLTVLQDIAEQVLRASGARLPIVRVLSLGERLAAQAEDRRFPAIRSPVAQRELLEVVARELGPPKPDLPVTRGHTGDGSVYAAPMAGRHILVADDDEAGRLISTRFVQRLGGTVVAVPNGREAIECLSRERFDLVLMDCQMPVMDGFTATRHLRQVLGVSTCVLALTASLTGEEHDRCLEVGMQAVLVKPLREVEFARTVMHWLSDVPQAV